MCALRSFVYNKSRSLHVTHRCHCPRAFGHVRGRRFPSPQTGTPPRKAGACPLSNHATESDFPTTPRPMRVEIASVGDSLTLEEKGIKGTPGSSWWSSSSSWGLRVLMLAGSSGSRSSSSLIFSLVLVDWCVAGCRVQYLVLGAASCCGFESRQAGSSKTTGGGQVQAQALVSSSPFFELEAFNKDPTGSISLCVCLCVGPSSSIIV